MKRLLMGTLWAVIWWAACFGEVDPEAAAETAGAKYFTVPMAEIVNTPLYLATTEYNELVVRYAGSGSDLVRDDYITHADSILLLTGGLDSFLASGEKEVVVPVVDDADEQHGGRRLLGFVMLTNVLPRKLAARRGEIAFDLEEGGPAPSMQIGNVMIGPGGVMTTDDKDYKPPQRGGGGCISSRDCYNFNGTCSAGKCSCAEHMTGSYCQLYRPKSAGLASLLKKGPQQKPKLVVPAVASGGFKKAGTVELPQPPPLDSARELLTETENGVSDREALVRMLGAEINIDGGGSGASGDRGSVDGGLGGPKRKLKPGAKRKPKPAATHSENSLGPIELPGGTAQDSLTPSAPPIDTALPKPPPAPTGPFEFEDPLVRFKRDREAREREAQALRDAEYEEQRKREEKVREMAERARQEVARRQSELDKAAADQASRGEVRKRTASISEVGAGDGVDQEQEAGRGKFATVDDLYGFGKAYPEPYLAGKVPRDLQLLHARMRHDKRGFVYSVRFRSGPLGVSFDNKDAAGQTRVERVAPDLQAQDSGIMAGDYVIAIDQFNVSSASAKMSQRILAGLGWPRILTLEYRGSSVDPEAMRIKEKLRSLNLTVAYPPSLQAQLPIRVAEWGAGTFRQDHLPSCPVFYVVAAPDIFGCDATATADTVSAAKARVTELVDAKGFGPDERLAGSPMLAMLLQESQRRQVGIDLQPLLLMKRGICTFVDKAVLGTRAGAAAVVIVNTEDALMDLPAGKEPTGEVLVPVAVARGNETTLTLMASKQGPVMAAAAAGAAGIGDESGFTIPSEMNEILAVLSDPIEGITSVCQRALQIIEDTVQDWPHSQPPMTVRQIVSAQNTHTTTPRGNTEDGGRVAVGGENGWAFFDYHLAMFGPQEVPLGPHRLQFAMPPFGCDPAAYTVRIAGSIVAILRGGGCSFGIKVINAQKLGAVAVIIVNTDDSKTMRLMALPDESPQISISRIMVSRRFQHFVDDNLIRHFLLDQHLVNVQPTGTFGDYEKRSSQSTQRV